MKGDYETAFRYYKGYISSYTKYQERNRDLRFVLNNIARIFEKRGEIDSAIFYAKKGLANAQIFNDQENLFNAGMLLSEYYKGIDHEAAFGYLKIATQAKDSMISIDKLRHAQLLSFNQQVRGKGNSSS